MKSWRICRRLGESISRPHLAPLVRQRISGWQRTVRRNGTISAAHLEFGQPVHETHPHVLKAGEITPGITAQEYADRRAALASSLPDDGVAVLAAADVKYRSGAVFYPFRQESNFLYLTGFAEPSALAVIRKTGPQPGEYDFHLFVRPKDAQAEQWSGPWSGVQAARDVFNADNAGDIHRIEAELPPILRGARHILTDIDISPRASGPTAALATLLRTAATSSNTHVAALQPLVNDLRAVKSPAEIANMRAAGRLSGRALTAAMRLAWTREKDLAAFLDYAVTSTGCDGPAYVPVVAGGPRGRLIHYVRNDAALDAGQLVLVDAGGEYGGYAADITRTWPVDGKFAAPQRELYEVVLAAQRVGVGMCRASGGFTLDGIHRVVEGVLREGLAGLGFPVGDGDGGAAMNVLFPHHVGHYLGLDVHDVPGYGRHKTLQAGHVITIEPGVYVPDDERWPERFRGLAVRIEDSVCVDDDSPLVLTTEAVKEVVDIEALRD